MKAAIEWANNITLKNPTANVLMDEYKIGYPALSVVLEDYFKKSLEQKRILLPNLHFENETIMILSDYGGESKDSNYLTFTFLFCAYKHLGFFFEEMKKIREKYGLNNPIKEISFKDQEYGPIKRCLDDYLNAINYLVPGLVFTIVVDKNVQTVFGQNKKEAQEFLKNTLISYGFGDWKPEVSEKLIFILHSISYLIGLLSIDNQKIFWMTDNDSIVPNQGKLDVVLKLFGQILSLYTKNKFPVIGGAIPFKEKDTNTLDLLSIADLVAGSIEHYLTRDDELDDLTIKDGANKVLMWLALDGISLKKQSIIIKKDDAGLRYSILQFNLKDPPKDIKIIPIYE